MSNERQVCGSAQVPGATGGGVSPGTACGVPWAEGQEAAGQGFLAGLRLAPSSFAIQVFLERESWEYSVFQIQNPFFFTFQINE